MSTQSNLRYFGWSCFAIESAGGDLLFDPFYRPMHGAKWAKLDDFRNTKVICVTHGHYEHYLDIPAVVKLTGAIVVGAKEVCDHLNLSYDVPRDRLFPIRPFHEIEVSQFKITTFEWEHRNISFLAFFKGSIHTAVQFIWNGVFKSPFNAPKFGYYVEGPDGIRVMHYGEGFSNLIYIQEVRELGKRFSPDILLAGMQLKFEKYLADGVAAFSPKTVVLFHPHEKLFEKVKLVSSTPQTFAENIKQKLPDAEIIIAKPMAPITVYQSK